MAVKSDTEMGDLLQKDEGTLQDMLDASIDFQERRRIRAALKQIQGLNWPDGSIKTYSFKADTSKSRSSLSSVSSRCSSLKSGSFSDENSVVLGTSTLKDDSVFGDAVDSFANTSALRKKLLNSETRKNLETDRPRHSSSSEYWYTSPLKKYLRKSPLKSDSGDVLYTTRTLSPSRNRKQNSPARNKSASSLLDSRTEQLLAKYSRKSLQSCSIDRFYSTSSRDNSPMRNYDRESLSGNKNDRLNSGSSREQSPMRNYEKEKCNVVEKDKNANNENKSEKQKFRSYFYVESFGVPNRKSKDLLNNEDNYRKSGHSDLKIKTYLREADDENSNDFQINDGTKSLEIQENSSNEVLNNDNHVTSDSKMESDSNGNLDVNGFKSLNRLKNAENTQKKMKDFFSKFQNGSAGSENNEISTNGHVNDSDKDVKNGDVKDADIKNISSVPEVKDTMGALQEKLRQCTDFAERRKIRADIRAQRDKKNAFDSSVQSDTRTTSQRSDIGRQDTTTREITPLQKEYKDYQDIDKLRKLLAETTDYDEKKQIRLVLRQLRQKDRERENGEKSKLVNGRGLDRSQSVIDYPRHGRDSVRDGGDVTNSVTYKPKYSRSISAKEQRTDTSLEKCSEPLTSISDHNSLLNGYDEYKNNDLTSRFDESENFLSPSLPKQVTSESQQSLSNESHIPTQVTAKSYASLTLSVIGQSEPKSEFQPIKTSLSSVESSSLPKSSNQITSSKRISFQDFPSNRCQNSTDKEILSTKNYSNLSITSSSSVRSVQDDSVIRNRPTGLSCKEWLDHKKRKASLPINVLRSNMDIEAAFSDLLNAVDQKAETPSDDVDKTVLSELVDKEEKEDIKESRNETIKDEETTKEEEKKEETDIPSLPEPKSNAIDTDNAVQTTAEKQNHGIICTTPVKSVERPFLNVSLTPEQNTVSEIEDDDGSVTVTTYSNKDLGDHTVKEKVTLRRSESHSQEEEKDTVIESNITSPGGNSHYEKDVIKTKRKITSRGSDYFSRSAYVTRRRKDSEGKEHEQHEVCMETDNFSVSRGESWGDRAEASMEVSKPNNAIRESIQEEKSSQNSETLDTEIRPFPGHHNRMDLSKTSSGYGSVSGSDEDDKEETTVTTYQGRPPGCPEIKSMLKDVRTLESNSAVLECSVLCSSLPHVTWYKGDDAIDLSQNYETKFDRLTGKASLVIMNAKPEDCGTYRCVFKNSVGQAETKSNIFVKSQIVKRPEITTILSDMTVTEGHSVVLECCVTNASQVYWYKDGIVQRNSSDFKQTFDGKIAKLEICEIFLDDRGEYSCVAKNDSGEAKTSCKIMVKENVSDSEVVPMFLNKPSSQIINGGDKVVLECDVIGSPQPKILWHKDGQPLSENGRYKQVYDGRVAILIISQSVPEDSGKYECIAMNSAGRVSVDALIVVKARQGPPTILHPLADVTAVVGKPLVLQCDVRGNPAPMILWRKNERIIGNTKDFKQTYSNNLARLEISDIFEQDGGTYECVAQNTFGAITSRSKVTVEENAKERKQTGKNVDKNANINIGKSAWLVGRGVDPVDKEEKSSSRDVSVKRCVSMKLTPTESKIRDRFRKDFIPKTEKSEPAAISKELNNNDEIKNREQVTEPSADISGENSKIDEIDTRTSEVKKQVQNTNEKLDKEPPWKNIKLRRTESARILPARRDGGTPWFSKGKEGNKEESKKIVNDVLQRLQLSERESGLKRSASDRVLNFDKNIDESDIITEKPLGWRQVALIQNEENVQPKTDNDRVKGKPVTLRRSESARFAVQNSVPKVFISRSDISDVTNGNQTNEINLRRTESAKILSSDQVHQRLTVNDKNENKDSSSDLSDNETETKTLQHPKVRHLGGLQRSESARLLFESRGDLPPQKQEVPQRDESPVGRFLGKKDISVRRTSSLKITPSEREGGIIRFKNLNRDRGAMPDSLGGNTGDSFVNKKRQLWENNSSTTSSSAMPSYDTIDDEDELHKILSNTEDFEERKKIRARMKQLREEHTQKVERERKEREMHTEQAVRRKYEQAEKEKKAALAQFDKMAKTASAERDKHLQTGQDLLKEKIRQADEDKKAKLAEYDKLAGKKEVKVTVSKADGTTTIIKQTDSVSKSPGFGGMQYGKPTAEQAAKFLTNQLISTSSPGTSGRISVKTESWNSQDGVTQKSEKTESWGAKPQGARGAMAAFKQMDSTNAPKANALVAVSFAKKAATTMRRNAAAIKQEILDFCQKNTKEYENVEITNLSTSWNNGMAFCALIHHFFPDAFDYSKLDPKNRRYNFDLAFNTAEKCADIAPLLDTDDMVRMQKPDWKCVFTYVQSIYRHLRDHDDNKQSAEQ